MKYYSEEQVINLLNQQKEGILNKIYHSHSRYAVLNAENPQFPKAFNFGELPSLVERTGKMIESACKDTWVVLQGDEHGFKEWYAERNKLNVNLKRK